MRFSLALSIALVATAAATAAAQPAASLYPPPPPAGAGPPGVVMRVPMERHGLFGGGALWGGDISCDGGDCGDGFREAGGASGHVGYMVTPRLGLVLDVWAMTSSKDDVALTFAMGTVGARLWLIPGLWVQGGIGSGHAIARIGPFDAESDDVPVAQLAAGIEVVRGRGWALDVSAKFAQGASTDEFGDDITTGRAAAIGASVSFFQRRPHAR